MLIVAPSGLLATPSRIAAQAAPNTPSCLPRNSPAAMPSGTGSSRSDGVSPANDTPALANPNTGTTA